VSKIADNLGMKRDRELTTWRDRLLAEIDKRETSQRSISIAANLSPGAVNSWLRDGKDPSVDHLIAVCGALGVSLSYLIYGLKIDPQTEELLGRLESDPMAREHIFGLLEVRSRKSPQANHEPPPLRSDPTS
jgi:transcriptional regulator with XRE-family HTH domain